MSVDKGGSGVYDEFIFKLDPFQLEQDQLRISGGKNEKIDVSLDGGPAGCSFSWRL
jgi:hypothetical protein